MTRVSPLSLLPIGLSWPCSSSASAAVCSGALIAGSLRGHLGVKGSPQGGQGESLGDIRGSVGGARGSLEGHWGVIGVSLEGDWESSLVQPYAK